TAQSIAEIEDTDDLVKWSFQYNHHVNTAQALKSKLDTPARLRLETRESRWPHREQSVTLLSDPPMGYRLVFAQDERVGLVVDTGFFFQDRWRSLFLQPRDIHLGSRKGGTVDDADPGDIEGAPFFELAGIQLQAPRINLAKKDDDLEFQLFDLDQLQVRPQWYTGGGVFAPKRVASGSWAPKQLETLVALENNLATKIYDTPASKRARGNSLPWRGKYFGAAMFEHPYAERFVGQVRAHGVAGLLAPTEEQDPGGLARQQLDRGVFSAQRYNPNKIGKPWPRANIDFSPGGAYSLYNWELFFHAPLLLAKRLTARQRFEEADDWLRKIFDPTASDGEAPARFWQIRPFFENAQPPDIHALLLLLHYEGTDAEMLAAREAFEQQIWRWRRTPFDPHLIAGLRDGTYQRAVIMAYLDNLIAWGDSLFSRDSIESIEEATQLYILAQNILGPRPVMIDPHGEVAPQNFEELAAGGLDGFGNAVVELENYFGSPAQTDSTEHTEGFNTAWMLHTWYFCVPPN